VTGIPGEIDFDDLVYGVVDDRDPDFRSHRSGPAGERIATPEARLIESGLKELSRPAAASSRPAPHSPARAAAREEDVVSSTSAGRMEHGPARRNPDEPGGSDS
jgi:hypothetical protein